MRNSLAKQKYNQNLNQNQQKNPKTPNKTKPKSKNQNKRKLNTLKYLLCLDGTKTKMTILYQNILNCSNS